jgi:catechol 2,3-dioxygenase-like lactoylglutathione lyase family enzyme
MVLAEIAGSSAKTSMGRADARNDKRLWGICSLPISHHTLGPTGTFGITTPINGAPATHGNGSTLGFAVQSPEQGDAFHAAGVANGGTTCEDPPGFREGPTGKIYLAYLREPDGNKICALHRPAK